MSSSTPQKLREKQKSQFDRKAKASKIAVGDKVLVKILAFDGKHKIADRFEKEVYQVIDQPRPEIPVYRIRSTDGTVKTLHRNHLLPVNIADTEEATDKETTEGRPKPRAEAFGYVHTRA